MSDVVSSGLTFTNPQIQRLRRLLGRRRSRQEEGAFVVEGPLLVAEAVAAGWEVEAQYIGPGVPSVSGAGPVHTLGRGVASRISDTETPRGIFAVVRVAAPADDVLQRADLVVVADRITDPGNLGTILRSAEAAGVDAVVLTPGTVDAFNPKVVRASAGSVFHVPVLESTLEDTRTAGLRLVGTSSHQGVPHTEADWAGRVAIVAGGEAHGLRADAPVDQWVRIEHRGRAESLNVAMAVTVLCFEAARARHSRF